MRVFGFIRNRCGGADGGRPTRGDRVAHDDPQQRKGKLTGSGSFECAMGEIAVIPSGDGEHADEVEGGADAYGNPTPADDEHAETDQSGP